MGFISIQLTFTAMGFVGQEIQVETEKKKQLVCPAVRGRTRQNQQNRERKSSEREPRWRGPKAKQEVQGGLIQLSPMHEQVKEDEV